MKVAEVMTLGAKTCSPNDTLHGAAKIMWEEDCGCVPVVDRNSKLVGILTDRDICMAAYTQGMTLHALRVESAMAPNVISCNGEDELAEAEKLMRQHKIRRLAVLENGNLTGILSLSDIAREADRERTEGQRREIKAAEIAETLGEICAPRAHVSAHVAFGPEEGERESQPTPRPKRGHLHKPHDRPGR